MARKSRKNPEAVEIETTSTAAVYEAGGYVRLSVEDNRKKGDSVDTQKAILQSYIFKTPGIKLRDFYIDNGVSGTKFERPAFQRMLADAEKGVINCIVVKDLSRLGRSAIDTGYYIEKYLPSFGCRFIAVNDDFDSNSVDNGAGVLLPLKNVINEAYALDIGRKVKAQQRQAMKSGEYVGARPPYGYLKAADNCHKLVVDPITAPIVRHIYEMFLGGTSVNEIVLRLNGDNIATPSHYRRELGIIKHDNLVGNGAWQTFTVSKILSDAVYTGDMVQGKSKSLCRKQTAMPESEWIRVPDTHEAIISRDDFEKAQERLRCLAGKAAARLKKPYTPNIFKSKVFCGHCGGSMHRQRQPRKKTDDAYIFYCLSNSRKARGSCVPFIMPEEDLKTALLATIQAHTDVIIGKTLKLRKNSADLEAQRQSVKAEIAALRQEADKGGRMFKNLYESLVSGLITKDEYMEMRESYEAKARESISRASELENWQAELDRQIAEYCEISDLLTDAANSGVTEKIVDCLVDRIRIFSDRSIEVDFKFDSGFELISGVAADA
jgi:DNA invertase Pin-like site-specific DNA recombinase